MSDIRLVYTSLPARDLGLADLQDIIFASYRGNQVREVTGRLWHNTRAFLQVLEGPTPEVDALLASIARDKRHCEIVVHAKTPVERRRLYNWDMNALSPGAPDLDLAGHEAVARFDSATNKHRITGLSGEPKPGEIAVVRALDSFLGETWYPCVGAKSARARRQITTYVGRDIESAWDDLRITTELVEFAHAYAIEPTLFQSFVVLFPRSRPLTETEFEHALWERVHSLQAKDVWLGQPLDPSVSDNPDDPHFSLSFGGQAFFIVGLHPGSSRPARRFHCPALVFNLHDQFERLRTDGRYETMREAILNRDEALAGSINPMLARHGESSEARQYSGRAVGPDWVCPYPGRHDL